MKCPDPSVVLEYVEGRLTGATGVDFDRHIAECPDCRRIIAELARTGSIGASGSKRPGQVGSPGTIPRGAQFGRYLVLDRLGEGAMGVVYSAYDPELDRKVALKLLRPDAASAPTLEEARARLMREAQVMARLAHPNVIAVYDIGEVGEQVFLTMELVAGCTLTEWLRAQGRAWREVLATFIAAGRGLAAAHAVGLIHRDFKPDNVLVGQDGRVRVTDFGLALLATPAYMAPEQHQGQPADARSDQFSFCVALYEGLYRQHPFGGGTVEERAASSRQGPVRPTPPRSRVPAWLRRAVLRGLEVAPAERHASMDDLLALLSSDRGAGMRRGLVAAALLAILGAGVMGYLQAGRRGALLCSGAEQKLAGIWDGGRRAAVRHALVSSGRPFADDTWRGVERSLSTYAASWSAMHRRACEATRLRGEQSVELLDLRMECLDSRLEELRTLVDLLASADAALTERAVPAVGSLSGLSDCGNAGLLLAPVPPPRDTESVRKVELVRRRLAQAKAESDAGRFSQALKLATQAAAEAESLRYAPLAAEALSLRGDLEDKAGDPKRAQQTLEEALLRAEAGRHDRAKAETWIRLVWVVGLSLAHYDEGRALGRQAAATMERLGPDDELAALLENNLGLLARAHGKFDQAAAHLERALALREKLLGPNHPDVAAALSGLGSIYLWLGRYEQALGPYRRVVAIREQLLGPNHPDVAKAENNLAILYREMGRVEEALAHQQRAISVWEQAIPGDHPNLASFLDNQGTMLRRLGRYDEALGDHRRACDILTRIKGREHPNLALCLNNIGLVYQSQKRWPDAIRYHQRALAIVEKAEGPEHPDAAMAHRNLGLDFKGMGRLILAETQLRRAVEIRSKASGPDHAETIDDTLLLAEVLGAQHRPRDALALLKTVIAAYEKQAGTSAASDVAGLVRLGNAVAALGRSEAGDQILARTVALLQARSDESIEVADARFALAKLLWPRDAGRSRAAELARAARAAYERSGRVESQKEVEAWLAARTRGGSARAR